MENPSVGHKPNSHILHTLAAGLDKKSRTTRFSSTTTHLDIAIRKDDTMPVGHDLDALVTKQDYSTQIELRRQIANLTLTFQSHKSFRTKMKLAKAQKQNRPIPHWIRLRTGNTIRYDQHRPMAITPSPKNSGGVNFHLGFGKKQACLRTGSRHGNLLLIWFLGTMRRDATGARHASESKF